MIDCSSKRSVSGGFKDGLAQNKERTGRGHGRVMMPTRQRGVCTSILVCALLFAVTCGTAAAQSKDPVAQAIEDGDAHQSTRDYQLALDSYREADNLSHHSSAQALLKMALIEKKAGSLPDAARDAKNAVAAAGDDKTLAWQARLLRAAILTSLARRPDDDKLREAESELRAAILLIPSQPMAHLNLGIVLLKQERNADGIAELNALLALPKIDAAMAAEARHMISNPVRVRAPFLPSFSFTTREKQSVSNTSLHGKVTLLDFWGSWCPPCRESVPILRNLQRKYAAKGFQLVGVSSDDDEDAWKTFMKSQYMDWPDYLDSSGTVQQAFRIDSFPTFIVADKDGVIRLRQSGLGPETQSDLENAINDALKREPDPVLAKASADAELDATEVVEVRPRFTNKLAKPDEVMAAVVDESAIASPKLATKAAPLAKNVFKNAKFGVYYEYPQGWTVAPLEVLQDVNEHLRVVTRGNSPPTVLLYASRNGEGDPEEPEVSSISIRAQQTGSDASDEKRFRADIDKLASAGQLKLLSPAGGFAVEGHKFLRADFERTKGTPHCYQAIVETRAR
ncbi:MAG TPA: redoxin family protein, partial [Candidatus Acidoferrum sp.]|nr:redoxin family protein [Candidatus Acidoferrum sp.]